MNERCRYPLNVEGDFYVEAEMCMACTAPEHEATDLMASIRSADVLYHCYFKRQPKTPDEIELAINAIRVACCGAVRYCGTDLDIIRRLSQLGVADACDLDSKDGI